MKIKIKYFNFFKHPLLGISFFNWFKVLYNVRFKFNILFIPKIIFITIISLLNVPFHFFEFLFYSKKIKRQVVKSPIFILGHFRSGTTLLHYLLTKDKQFTYCSVYDALLPNISLIGGRLLKYLIALSLPSKRPQDNVEISINSPKEEEFAIANMSQYSYMFSFYFPKNAYNVLSNCVLFDGGGASYWKDKLDFFIKKLTMKSNGKRIVLKSPANTARVKEILDLYPDAKFIHITRNPYDVYSSTIRLYEKIIPITSFQNVDVNYISNYILKSYRLIYEKYINDIKFLKSNQLVQISFDDLEQEPLLVIKKIYKELDIKGIDSLELNLKKEIKEISKYKKNKYKPLGSLIKKKIQKEWGGVAEKIGLEL